MKYKNVIKQTIQRYFSLIKQVVQLFYNFLKSIWNKTKMIVVFLCKNKDIMRNIIAILVCIIMEIIGVWIYIHWTSIGETRLVFESETKTAQIISDRGGATYGNFRYKLQNISDSISASMNYGGLNNFYSDSNHIHSDTALIRIYREGQVLPYTPRDLNDTISIIKDSPNEWNNAPKASGANYMNITTIEYNTTVPYVKRNQNDTIPITNSNEEFASGFVVTYIKSHRLISRKKIYRISKKDVIVDSQYDSSRDTLQTIEVSSGASLKPQWYRFEDLSRRIIRVNLHNYKDKIEEINLDFCGPFKIVSADKLPDSTTFTKMLFFKPNTIEALKKYTSINFYIEFPYKERIQDARILALTTLMISVLLTLIINCFIAVGKIVRRENRIKQIKIDAVPCYGSFSDCSECNMYDVCTFRPDGRRRVKIHRKQYTQEKEEKM